VKSDLCKCLGIGLGIGLHLGLNCALWLGFFGWIMVAAYLALLTAQEAGKLLVGAREIAASVGQRLGPRRDVADRATGWDLTAKKTASPPHFAGKPQRARQDSNL
jgi:hypothetical protein